MMGTISFGCILYLLIPTVVIATNATSVNNGQTTLLPSSSSLDAVASPSVSPTSSIRHTSYSQTSESQYTIHSHVLSSSSRFASDKRGLLSSNVTPSSPSISSSKAAVSSSILPLSPSTTASSSLSSTPISSWLLSTSTSSPSSSPPSSLFSSSTPSLQTSSFVPASEIASHGEASSLSSISQNQNPSSMERSGTLAVMSTSTGNLEQIIDSSLINDSTTNEMVSVSGTSVGPPIMISSKISSIRSTMSMSALMSATDMFVTTATNPTSVSVLPSMSSIRDTDHSSSMPPLNARTVTGIVSSQQYSVEQFGTSQIIDDQTSVLREILSSQEQFTNSQLQNIDSYSSSSTSILESTSESVASTTNAVLMTYVGNISPATIISQVSSSSEIFTANESILSSTSVQPSELDSTKDLTTEFDVSSSINGDTNSATTLISSVIQLSEVLTLSPQVSAISSNPYETSSSIYEVSSEPATPSSDSGYWSSSTDPSIELQSSFLTLTSSQMPPTASSNHKVTINTPDLFSLSSLAVESSMVMSSSEFLETMEPSSLFGLSTNFMLRLHSISSINPTSSVNQVFTTEDFSSLSACIQCSTEMTNLIEASSTMIDDSSESTTSYQTNSSIHVETQSPKIDSSVSTNKITSTPSTPMMNMSSGYIFDSSAYETMSSTIESSFFSFSSSSYKPMESSYFASINVTSGTPVMSSISISTPDPTVNIANRNVTIKYTFSGKCHFILNNHYIYRKFWRAILEYTETASNNTIAPYDISLIETKCDPFYMIVSASVSKGLDVDKLFNEYFQLNNSLSTIFIRLNNGTGLNVTITHYELTPVIPEAFRQQESPLSEIIVISTAAVICGLLVTFGLVIFTREYMHKRKCERFRYSPAGLHGFRGERVALRLMPRSSMDRTPGTEMQDNGSLNGSGCHSYDLENEYSTISNCQGRKTAFMTPADMRASNHSKSKTRSSTKKSGRKSTHITKQSRNMNENTDSNSNNNKGYGLVIGLLGYKSKQRKEPEDTYAVPHRKTANNVQGLSIKPTDKDFSELPTLPIDPALRVGQGLNRSPTPPSRHLRHMRRHKETTESVERLVPSKKKEDGGSHGNNEDGVVNKAYAEDEEKKETHSTNSNGSVHL